MSTTRRGAKTRSAATSRSRGSASPRGATAKGAAAKGAAAKKTRANAATGPARRAGARRGHSGENASGSTPVHVIGTSPRRVDGAAKARGATRYLDDLAVAGALVGHVVTSPHVHARITRIDATEARRCPGVHAVLLAADLPGENQVGAVIADQPLLVVDHARSPADRLALIAAESRAAAQEAARRILVEAEPLPGVFDPIEALGNRAPRLHTGGNLCTHMVVRKGDTAAARARADVVIENTYTTGLQEHAYLETNAALAEPLPDGSVFVRGSMQAPFYVRKSVARVLGLPLSKVQVEQTPTGGGFGGKEDYPSEPACCAALLARATGRPVKLVYERGEDMAWSTKRHATVIKHRLMARNDGSLVGLEAEIYFDAGAYCGLSGIVAERANSNAAGPYLIPHVTIDTYTVYTNNPFGGAYRGFGQPQVTFALESQMDLLAAALGRDPLELREQNFLRKGSRTATSELLRSPPLAAETLAAARTTARWTERRRELAEHNAAEPYVRRGIGAASVLYGCCLHAGGQHMEGSAALVQVHADASVSVSIGGAEIGQGAFTAVAMIAAESLGVPLSHVDVRPTNTTAVPDSGPTVASRTTVMSGNAVLDATRQIRARLLDVASSELGAPARDLELRQGRVFALGRPTRLGFAELVGLCFVRKVSLTASGWYAPPRKKWDPATGRGQPYSVYCYAGTIAEVSVDTVTGLVTVDRVSAAHDVGRAIFRAGVEAQIQGGIVQGIGYATTENVVVRGGRILNPNFTDYLVPTALDVPEIDITLVEEPWDGGPFGAKGIGEPALIPVAAAVANAVADALGIRFFDLPLSPERVKMAWEHRRRGLTA